MKIQLLIHQYFSKQRAQLNLGVSKEKSENKFQKIVSRQNSSILDGITFRGEGHAQQGFRT